MADNDPLVRFRDAALACNEAARIGAAWFREKDNENPETARDAIPRWIAEIEKACLDWSILSHSAEKPLDAIKQAAAAHPLPPIQIGSFSYQTAHEAANGRATFVAWCLRGDLEKLPEGIATDLVGRIEQEYLQAKAAALDQDDDSLLDRLRDILTKQQFKIVECLRGREHGVGFDEIASYPGAFRDVPDDEAVKKALDRIKLRLVEEPLDIEVSPTKRRAKLVLLTDK